MTTYKPTDIFLQRRNTNNNGFDEYDLHISPNTILMVDANSNIVAQQLSYVSSSNSASYAITASYAMLAELANIALYAYSSSMAANSISASYINGTGGDLTLYGTLGSIDGDYSLAPNANTSWINANGGTLIIGGSTTSETYILDIQNGLGGTATIGNTYGTIMLYGTASKAIQSQYATSASWASSSISSSYASFAPISTTSTSSSFSNNAVNATTSTSASFATTASYALNVLNTSSYISQSNLVGTASLYSQAFILTGSYTSVITASYTLTQNENGKFITVISGSLVTITVPSTLQQGYSCTLYQSGSGKIIVAGSGVNIRNRSSLSGSYGQYAAISLIQIDSANYLLQGDVG